MWNKFSTSSIFDLRTSNAPQKNSQSILITSLKQRITIFLRKKGFWSFLSKNRSFLFRAKKNFDGNFFVEITKTNEKLLPDESSDVIGKSQDSK